MSPRRRDVASFFDLPRRSAAPPWRRYAVAALSVAAALAVNLALREYLTLSVLVLPLAAVAVSAWYGGLGPALVATVLGLACAVAILLPGYSLAAGVEGVVSLAVFLLVAVLVSALHVTRRRAVEAARDVADELHHDRERLQLAVEAAQMGTWSYDVLTDRVEWSENMEAVHGLEPGSFPGTYEAYLALVHPDDRDRVAGAVEKALNEASAYEAEFRIRRPDGSEAWILGKGRVLLDERGFAARLLGVGLDVTARKAAERERARLLALEQQARQDAEKAEQRAQFLSDAAVRLASSLDYETTLNSVARLSVPEIADWCVIDVLEADGSIRRIAIVHDDPAKVEQAWAEQRSHPIQIDEPQGAARVLRTGAAELYPEMTDAHLQAAARSPEHLEVLRGWGIRSAMWVPLVARGRTLGAMSFGAAESGRSFGPVDLAFAERLAQRCALAVDNARLYGEAQEANRAKDEFLATLSHELRTPLNAIAGWTYLLRQGTLGPEQAEQALQVIERNTRMQARLVDDLLDLSRIVTGKLRLELRGLELGPVVNAALDVVRPAAEARQIRLEATVGRDVGPVLGDPSRLQQAIWNVLSNAVKFTPREGSVRVEVSRTGLLARISVTDTGKGISPELLPHLFERFRQGDSTHARRHGGLGLGLAIVRHIVELHGGTVWAESAGERRGSTFVIELPVSRLEGVARTGLGQAGVQSGGEEVPSLAGLRVLVVEDERDARELVRVLLTRSGAQVQAVASADQALQALAQHPAHVVVSDLGLPGVDGYELVRRINHLAARRGLRIPVVALTAYAQDHDRRRAVEAGFQAYVTKPVDPAALASAIVQLAAQPSLG
ncbi:MAG TPA: ATP-binding protein [Gemmatimonadota bacterium]|jgi:PAS domain S-box-containing protein